MDVLGDFNDVWFDQLSQWFPLMLGIVLSVHIWTYLSMIYKWFIPKLEGCFFHFIWLRESLWFCWIQLSALLWNGEWGSVCEIFMLPSSLRIFSNCCSWSSHSNYPSVVVQEPHHPWSINTLRCVLSLYVVSDRSWNPQSILHIPGPPCFVMHTSLRLSCYPCILCLIAISVGTFIDLFLTT